MTLPDILWVFYRDSVALCRNQMISAVRVAQDFYKVSFTVGFRWLTSSPAPDLACRLQVVGSRMSNWRPRGYTRNLARSCDLAAPWRQMCANAGQFCRAKRRQLNLRCHAATGA